jgi:hypothetical protein
MVSAVIIAVVALVGGIVALEVFIGTESCSEFFFALLDRLVSDESDIPDPLSSVAKRSSQRAA